jgi:hypothetical protein
LAGAGGCEPLHRLLIIVVVQSNFLYYNSYMASSSQTANHFLSLRLDESDAALMQTLYGRTGLSKTEIVKLALRKLANETQPETSLFDMGASKFGRYGDVRRQSTQIKSVVRERIADKRTREK